MAAKVGSARSDENRHAHGGKAGDQDGREVSTQDWYLHSKGWRVFRLKDPAKAARIGKGMQAACDNPKIGYDQYQRHTLFKAAAAYGYDPGQVRTACETDCSALVRVLLAMVGISVPEGFRTGNMPSYLLGTGQVVELAGDKYTKQSAYLKAGDILVTRTSGHTVVVITDGPKAGQGTPIAQLGDRALRAGCRGDDVKELQNALLSLDYDLPKWGADGDYGNETVKAVNAFKLDHGLKVDGIFGRKAVAAIKTELEEMRS